MIQFRQATEMDFEAICNLITSKEELFLVYPAGKYPFTLDQLHTLSQLRKELTVAETDEKIIAFANLYDYEAEKFAFIGNVVVDKTLRGKGIGEKLIANMLQVIFQKNNLPEARISVFSNNTPAINLYTKFGFEQFSTEERTDPNGNNTTLIHMRLSHNKYLS